MLHGVLLFAVFFLGFCLLSQDLRARKFTLKPSFTRRNSLLPQREREQLARDASRYRAQASSSSSSSSSNAAWMHSGDMDAGTGGDAACAATLTGSRSRLNSSTMDDMNDGDTTTMIGVKERTYRQSWPTLDVVVGSLPGGPFNFGTKMATFGTNSIFKASDLKLGEVLGEGTFGVVYKALCKRTGQTVVVKELKNTEASSAGGSEQGQTASEKDALQRQRDSRLEREVAFIQEVSLLKSLSHPNVLRFIGLLFNGTTLQMITEYVAGGDLEELIDRTRQEYANLILTMDQKVCIAIDICRALDYLHAKQIVHRDLKPQNCLVSVGSKGGGGEIEPSALHFSIVLADLGLARVLEGEVLRADAPHQKWLQGAAAGDVGNEDAAEASRKLLGPAVKSSSWGPNADAALPNIGTGTRHGLGSAHKGAPAEGPAFPLSPIGSGADEEQRVRKDPDVYLSGWVHDAMETIPRKMGQIGTVDYMAPEICLGLEYTESVDVFSFGILFGCRLLAEITADADSIRTWPALDLNQKKFKKMCAKKGVTLPPKLEQLAFQCASADPRARPRFPEIIAILRVSRLRMPRRL